MGKQTFFPSDYQYFIYKSRYARFLDEQGRREEFEETVNRYISFLDETQCPDILTNKEKEDIKKAILNLEVMPSMRALMTAGKALGKCNVAGYNCAYLAINKTRAFAETLYILMCGTGVGFSVERQEINRLPEVPEIIYPSDTIIVVPDSKIGWATALDELINLLFAGKLPKFDFSKLRPAGARLKTFGGRSSGPEPLKELFLYIVSKFRDAQGRKLTSLECHDIVCKIAEIVVVGGVRRSALISLSNLSDERMRTAKCGDWWTSNPQRALANNSAAYTEKPEIGTFMKEWQSLYESKSGERGIFNREAANKQVSQIGRREPHDSFGTNPCSEIILRPQEFCNLTEVVIRASDTLSSLIRKIKLATILGTLQSTLTNFRYLSNQWKKNCEEERLLGVSLTGIMDNEFMSGKNLSEGFIDCEIPPEFEELPLLAKVLSTLKKTAIDTNKKWAKKLDIPVSAAITAVKPSGTVSQMCDTASGIHARYAPYYIRTVRADKKDPLAQFMKDAGVPCESDVMKPDSVYVFSFPIKSPDGAIHTEDRTAIQQLELWLQYQTYYCEHKPSVTINVKEHEWLEVGAWAYKHFDEISGISFLPWLSHNYKQAPYQPISKEEYEMLVEQMPKNINWNLLTNYEKEDTTIGSQEFACSGNSCEIVDILK